MGLRARFILDSNKYPKIVNQTVTIDGATGVAQCSVNYSQACAAFVSTFMKVATSSVPVDTGYLRSTIKAETNGSNYCLAEAKAEYAQYVEYGTWKMAAQPYFTPALRAAMENFQSEAIQAIQEANTKAKSQATAKARAELQKQRRRKMQIRGGVFLGTLGAAIAMIVLFPILVLGYAIIDAMKVGSNNDSGNTNIPGLSMPDIEVT